jgi:hypothetical protein
MELEPLCTGVFLVNLNFQALTPKGGSIISTLTQGGGQPEGLKKILLTLTPEPAHEAEKVSV